MKDATGVEELLSRAEAALDLGRPAEAERAARGALAVEPGREGGHGLLARALLAQGRSEEALAAARGGLAVTPGSEWLHRLRALALREARRLPEALAAADEAVRLAPDVAPGHHLRSLVLESMRRLPAAREAAARAVELDPDSASYHSQLGDLWTEDDPVRSERHYRDALALDAARAMTLNNLGVALLNQKRPKEAALAFKSALLLDPTLEVAKRNTHVAAGKVIGGGAALAGLFVVTQGANCVRRLSRADRPELVPWAVGVALVAVAASLALWYWRRTAGVRRLAEVDPQLHAIYVKLEADRRAGRLEV